MKKIYLTLLGGFFLSQAGTGQTLTQSGNQPVAGDMSSFIGYDSTGIVPKTTGAGVVWNFAGFTPNINTLSSTFQSTTGVASATAFAGATLAENQGGGDYNFYKTVGTQYELLGSSSSGTGDFVYSNSAIVANFPVAMGYSLTDTYAGTLSGGLSGTIAGTITTQGVGTGTLITPNGQTFSNVLLVRSKNWVDVTVTSPFPAALNVVGVDYNFYHSSQKFPLMTVSYQTSSGFQASSSADIYVNNAIITGLNDKNFEASFQIFPNPAKDAFNVNLSNNTGENGVIEIYNSVGQLAKTINLGNTSTLQHTISLSDLGSGIYIVKTTIGSKSSSRKLIVE
jgi:hypothetical protein